MTFTFGALVAGLIIGLLCYFGDKPTAWSWQRFFTCLDIGLIFVYLCVQLGGTFFGHA